MFFPTIGAVDFPAVMTARPIQPSPPIPNLQPQYVYRIPFQCMPMANAYTNGHILLQRPVREKGKHAKQRTCTKCGHPTSLKPYHEKRQCTHPESDIVTGRNRYLAATGKAE